MIGGKPLIFPELCHGCGGCGIVCPEEVISEVPQTLGWLESMETNGLSFKRGRLKVGEAKSPPVIRALRKNAPKRDWTVIDAPPGTSVPSHRRDSRGGLRAPRSTGADPPSA
jgi:MinD superfamily P-loop ATPase